MSTTKWQRAARPDTELRSTSFLLHAGLGIGGIAARLFESWVAFVQFVMSATVRTSIKAETRTSVSSASDCLNSATDPVRFPFENERALQHSCKKSTLLSSNRHSKNPPLTSSSYLPTLKVLKRRGSGVVNLSQQLTPNNVTPIGASAVDQSLT